MSSSPLHHLMTQPVVRYSPIEHEQEQEQEQEQQQHQIFTPTHHDTHLLSPIQTNITIEQSDDISEKKEESCCYRHRLFLIMLTLLSTTTLILILILTYTHTTITAMSNIDMNITTCDIFCYGDVIHAIETAGILIDSKSYVDMPLLRSPADVMHDFRSLKNQEKSTLIAFLSRNYGSPGSDLLPWTPEDFKENPPFLKEIIDPTYHEWASELNTLWLSLGKQITHDVYEHPERHTLLPALSPFMIVPGGRFREYYYWDTYWIVRGLITCDMLTTAKIIVENLLYFVRTYGFVPNGSRIYYLNRSQPPFLTLTVQAYFNATQDFDMLRTALPLLDQEYQYWMTPGKHAVVIANKTTGLTYTLNRYFSSVNYPRPESYAEDMATALSMPWPFNPEGTKKREEMFAQLAASAETGWDFSSRFFRDRHNLSSANTMDIIPVDLNAILYINERTLSQFHSYLHNTQQQQYYQTQSEFRLDAIHALLWDEISYQWRDYNWKEEQIHESGVASNFIPLWTKCYRLSAVNESRVLASFIDSGLILPGGIVTTLSDNGQQWDWPNAWAPIQHMITEGVATLQGDASAPGRSLAFTLASNWLASNWISYNNTGMMYEKYNATSRGMPGHGGEYILQKGFGWTNGVALILLEQYGYILNLTQTLTSSKTSTTTETYHHSHTTQQQHPFTSHHHHTSISTHDRHMIHESRYPHLISPHLHTNNDANFAYMHRQQQQQQTTYHILLESSSTITTHHQQRRQKHKQKQKKKQQSSLQPTIEHIKQQHTIPKQQFSQTQAHDIFVERMKQKEHEHDININK